MTEDKPSLTEYLYGKEYSDNSNKIDEGIKSIGEKHDDWFKTTKSKFGDIPSTISEYIVSMYQPHIGLSLKVSDELPQYIRTKVFELCESVYGKPTK